MALTLSFVKGKGYLNHNERKILRSNIDENRMKDNIYFRSESVEQAYERIFGQAIEKYNEKQTRKDRKKTVEGYLQSIQEGQDKKNSEKVFYEIIVMLGDKETAGIKNNPEMAKAAAEVLKVYAETFQERNPKLDAFNISLHMDEETPHLHLDYIPVGDGYKTGLKRRNSLFKALENQGLGSKRGQFDNVLTEWQKREREYIAELAREKGIDITELGEKREDLTLHQYKRLANQAIEKAEQAPVIEGISLPLGRVAITKKELKGLNIAKTKIRTAINRINQTIEKSAEQEKKAREKLEQAKQAEAEAERLRSEAEEEKRKAMQVRQEYERLHLMQLNLNQVYNDLQQEYKAEKERSKEREEESYDQGDLDGTYSVLANLNRRVYIVDDEKSEQYLLGYYLDANNEEAYFVKYASLDSAKSSLEERNINNYQMHTDRQAEHEQNKPNEQNKPKIRFHRGGSGKDRGGMER